MKSAPSSAAFTISVGVIVPGIVIASRARPAAIISGISAGETRKRAPAMSASSACAPESTVPAPTMAPCRANSASVASAAMSSYASGTVSVISTRRTPAFAIARAASSAASTVGVRMTATRRSSDKIRTRSRRRMTGRSEMAIRESYLLPLDQEHPGRCSIAARDLERCAQQVVGAGTHVAEVETFDDHDAGTEERVVRGIAGLFRALRLDREVVDADEAHAAIDAPPRGRRVHRDDVAGEVMGRVAPQLAVARLDEEPRRVSGYPRALEPFAGDVLRAAVAQYDARPDERVDRQLLDGVPALDEVDRRIDVCAGVVAEREERDVGRVALRDAAQRCERRPRLAAPRGHIRPQREAHVMDLHSALATRAGYCRIVITPDDVERIFRNANAFRDGHFVLASGKHSPRYLEKFQVLQWPQETERLCGTRAVYAERDEHGPGRVFRRGFQLRPGERVLVVDDIMTTGGSVQETMDAVRAAGAEVIGAAVLVDRSGGSTTLDVPVRALWSIEVPSYSPADCPLCRDGIPVTKPGTTPAQPARA